MRADSRTALLPVVMLTARVDDASTWNGWRLGADIYIPKPFDPDHLAGWVTRLTRRAAANSRQTALRELRLLSTSVE